MSTSIECIVLLFLGLDFVVALHSLICNGVELGIQLKLALESIEGGGHCHNFVVVGRFGSPNCIGFESVKLALG